MESVTWLRPEYQGRENELIHLAAAADLVGVTRSAVSNWAARHGNFPKVVLLTGPHSKRVKYVVRAEFEEFARAQLNKPRGGPRGKTGPRRPAAVVQAGRVEHWERQVERLADLEARHAATLQRTREALADARGKLAEARGRLVVEVDAARQISA